ncbi:MAG: hypothetical protein ACRC4L_02225 [Mycoplasma sp.]
MIKKQSTSKFNYLWQWDWVREIGLLANWLNFMIYFCELYASYQRNSNEDVSGIIRRQCEKGSNFLEVTDQEIEEIQNPINNIPRKIFTWLSSSKYKISF